MNYVVKNRFNDKSDDNYTYVEEQEYPRKGAPLPSKNRIKFLIDRNYIAISEKQEKEVVENGKKL